MKNLFFFLFISSVFFMSCSEEDIIDIIDIGGENKVEGESSSNITTSASIFGQWMFNSYSGGGGGNEYGYGGGGEQICNVHSIIFSEDFTFNLYTDNFVLFGDYIIDTLDISRSKYPGTSNSLDALCKRFNVDLSRRTKHNALLDCELLREVYINLLDAKEPKLSFISSVNEKNELQKKLDYSKKILSPTEKELQDHNKFIKAEMKKNYF